MIITRRQALKRWPVFPFAMLLGVGLGFGQSQSAVGQGLKVIQTGVRHRIVATVEADHDAEAEKRDTNPRNATLDIAVRIMDYAPDFRFFGVIDGKFSDFDPASGAPAQEIWADRACHQNRGLPKIWVLAIDGKITRGENAVDIAARPRHVGEAVPKDEVVAQRDRELSDPNQNLVTLARTTDSRLAVKLSLMSATCRHSGD